MQDTTYPTAPGKYSLSFPHLPETFTCEVCCEEIPYPGYEKPRAPLGKRSSQDYPGRLCAYCSKESKKP